MMFFDGSDIKVATFFVIMVLLRYFLESRPMMKIKIKSNLDKPQYLQSCSSCNHDKFMYHGIQYMPNRTRRPVNGIVYLTKEGYYGYHLWTCCNCETTLADLPERE